MYIQNLFGGVSTVAPYNKSYDKCFDTSGPLLQIRSHVYIYIYILKYPETGPVQVQQLQTS